jgi:hypothetical protein
MAYQNLIEEVYAYTKPWSKLDPKQLLRKSSILQSKYIHFLWQILKEKAL